MLFEQKLNKLLFEQKLNKFLFKFVQFLAIGDA